MDVTRFHAHLDSCDWCTRNPFNLCAKGVITFAEAFDGGAALALAFLAVDQAQHPEDYASSVALVPVEELPIGGWPPVYPPRRARNRETLMTAIEDLAWEARIDDHRAVFRVLLLVVRAMRGGRAVDLEGDIVLFLQREGLL